MSIAIIIFFCFNYYIYAYLSKVLIGFNNKRFIYFIMSLLNTYLMVLAYDLKSPYYVSYFIVLFVLTLEFLIFSKAKFIQAFLFSGLIVINISTIQMLFIPIYAYIIKKTPYEIFYNKDIFFQGLSILLIVLFIVFYIISRFISYKDIIKISTEPTYSLMISSIIIFILLYTIIDVIVLQNEKYFLQYLLIFIAAPILNLILFYILFFYSIKSVNMVVFKRKSDELELLKIRNNINKKEIQNKILKDELTGCYNRKYITLNLQEKYDNNIFNFAIFFIDIDGLKKVNDTLGHKKGDEYIINVSSVLKDCIRDNDVIARLGGDEFIIIVNDVEKEDVNIVLNRINKNIEFLDNLTKDYKVSASIGVTFIDEQLLKTGVENIIKISDDEMRIKKMASKHKEKGEKI